MTDPHAPGNRPVGDKPAPARALTSRRAVLAGSVGALAGAAVGVGAAVAVQRTGASPSAADETTPSADAPSAPGVHGTTQAGIERPSTPQRFALFSIVDVQDPSDLGFLAVLGGRIAMLINDPPPGLLPDGPQRLTVTVGLGPRLVGRLDPTLPGAQQLPLFHGDDDIAPKSRGGDVLLMCCAEDPSILPPIAADLHGRIPGCSTRWSQFGYRGPGTGTVARNPLGFLDGISVPHTSAEFDKNVWIPDGPLAGAAICVLRRFALRIGEFHALPVDDRENVIGRRLDGSPLSGGGPDADINVQAKRPDGTYLIPLHAHVRVANPMVTGSHHMLRRSYSFDNGDGDTGLLFTCFQRDLRTFTITQRQLDRSDAMMDYVIPTATGTFLMLPGFTEASPLGSTLPTGA